MEKYNASQLIKGQKAEISAIDINEIPLKLIEMGCLPGNSIELIQIAPLGDPFFF
ncbi:MAG: Ferrous iron transport protein, partial [Bacteroidota bacterium]